MTPAVLRQIGADLQPIGLAELVERAALQTRVDRKYVVPLATVGDLITHLGSAARILEIDRQRSFRYESVYFDTPQLTSYLQTARRRRRRFKVRTRTYLDSSECWLEVKTRGARGATVKRRQPYAMHHRCELAPGRRFVDEVLAQERFPVGELVLLRPTLCTRYRRSTLFIPAAGIRVTIDTDLTWHDDSRELSLDGLAVIETKSSSAASDVDRLLWRAGHRPARISKYATGLAALRPQLPATPWKRTLRRHFAADRAARPRSLTWPQAS